IGLTSPTRNVPHIARLIDLKLETLAAMHDGGFGFEAIGLAVMRVESMPGRQTELNVSTAHSTPQDDAERGAALIDALRQRLGPDRVRQFEAVPRHIPESAETLAEFNGERSQFPSTAGRVRVGGSYQQDAPSLDRLTRSDRPLSGEGNWWTE